MDISNLNLDRFKATEKAGTYLPSGGYTAALHNCRYTYSKKNERILQLIWKIKDGSYSGRYFFSFINVSKQDSLNVLYKMIENMGFVPEEVENLNELYGNYCHLKVKCYKHPIYGPSNLVIRYLPHFPEFDADPSYDDLFSILAFQASQ